MRNWIPNPTTPGARKPVEVITDRAKRYRAQAAMPADTPRICIYCGRRGEMVDHIDGIEDHGEQENLAYSCRGCNVTKANAMREAGLGKKTRQYNPPKPAKGAKTLAEWVWAVSRVQRRDKRTGALLPRDNWKVYAPPKEVAAAVAMIRATPHHRRAEFAADLRAKRRPKKQDEDFSWLP